jgi:hypothetical protein
MKPDLTFYGLSGLYTLTGITAEGAEWIHSQVEWEPWQGNPYRGIAIEGTDRAQEIALAASRAGLRVEVNNKLYQGAKQENSISR